MITLTQNFRSQKRVRTQNPQSQQLNLLALPEDPEPPDSIPPTIRVEVAPRSWHGSHCDRFWIFVDGSEYQHGPLFHRDEADYLLSVFAGRKGRISNEEFGKEAERAVNLHNGRSAA